MTGVALTVTAFGVGFLLLAALGLVRFPDVYVRSHAAGKAATLGVCSVLIGVALGLGGPGAWIRSLAASAFLLVTVPVAAQLLARAAFRSGVPPAAETRIEAALRPHSRHPPGGQERTS